MATRDLAKKAGAAALEKTLLAVLPSLQEALAGLRVDVHKLDARVQQLAEKADERWEQNRELLNELGQRIIRVEGKFDGFTEATRQHSMSVQSLIERVVRLEMVQPASGRQAG